MLDTIENQARAYTNLKSPLYARLLKTIATNQQTKNIIHELLHSHNNQPMHDTIVLQLLNSIHQLTLTNKAPNLTASYPSYNKNTSIDPVTAFFAMLRTHQPTIKSKLDRTMQTNKINQTTTLLNNFVKITQHTKLPLHQQKINTSSKLLLN